MTSAWRISPWWRGAASAAMLLTVGCGGGESSGGCRSFDQLASADRNDDDPRVAAGTQLATVTKLQGAAAKDIAARLAPSLAPSFQAVEVGKTATWGVAVVQVADRVRTLKVDFGDGGAPSTSEVSKGSGACLFRVTRSFPSAGKGRAVKFTVLDPATPPNGPAVDAFVDIT